MSSDSEDSEGEDLGTIRPTLIRELRNILDLYPDDGQIIKELIQNAEDAGATVVKVLTDKRDFNQNIDARTLKKHPHLKFFKGPALCVYNNAKFSPADWKGIRMLHTSIKEEDPLKVGRFGLGFKSVFHLTDRLVILSGDYIMSMDPFKGEDCYCNWRRVAGRKGKELQSILKSLGGAFGITESTFQAGSGHFPGTLFWFPLRVSASDLSSTLYTDKSMENLLASFKIEAPSLILFLNHVQRVEILARDDTCDPKEIFSVGIAASCLRTIQSERDRFVQELTSAGADLPQDEMHSVTEVVMETSDHLASRKTSKRWLVVNYHCGRRQMSKALSQLCFDHQLCYHPYVGIAIPLTDQEHFQSQLFCFLPLPLNTRSPTGLPVHVHGYFALEQNRRHLKWPTADQLWNSATFDPASQWNCLLVTELLPIAYQRAVLRLLELRSYDPETFYRAWPDVNKVHDRWSPLLQPLYTYLAQQRIFFSHNTERQWVYLQNAVLQIFSPQFTPEVKNSVMKVYTANNQTIVELPLHIYNTLKHFGLLHGVQVISASHVSQFIPYSLPVLGRLDKLNLLHYLCCHDTQLLLNQTLLPLADGISFGTFRHPQKPKTFLCTDQLVQLFPCLEAQFCDNNIPRNIRDDLQRLANSGILSIQELHERDRQIPTLLQESLQARFGTGLPVVDASNPWICQVWQFLASVGNLSTFSHIPLLPVKVESNRVSLLPLTGRYMSSSARGMPSLSAALGGALTRLGITVLHDLPDYVTRHNSVMGNYVNYPSTQGILRAVQGVSDDQILKSNAIKVFNAKATGDEKAAFIQFLSSVRDSYVSLPSLFLHLSLFKMVLTNQNVSLNQVSQIGPSDLPPVPLPMSLLSCSPPERRAALCLGATEMSLQVIVETIIKQMSSRTCLYSPQEIIQFMKYFLQTKSLMSNSSLQIMSKSIPFVRTESGQLRLVKNVYDPSSALLRELFHSQHQIMFPVGEFADPTILKKLKKLGLRSENEVKSDDLICAANAIADLWSRNNQPSAKTSAEALFSYLNAYSSNFTTATLHAISAIQCLPCLQDQEKPAHYPKSLPVKSSPSLVRPADMHNYRLLTVVGSVAPVCRPEMSKRLADHCALQEPKSEAVLQHLRTITAYFQQQEVSQYKLILKEVFHHLQQSIHDLHVCRFLQIEKCVLRDSGESFACPHDFWIQRQQSDIDLKPFRFPLPVEMQPVQELMEKCGSSKTQTDQMLHDVLRQVQSKHMGLSVSHKEFQTDLQLVKQILEVLKKNKTANAGNTLLPIVHEQTSVLQFKPASECTVMSGNRPTNMPPDVGFDIYVVHPDVPINTALDLGACQMKDRALTGLEDLDFGYEQREDLTSRLHRLLQESYTDGFSVPKELLQNADDSGASKVCFLLDERENMDCRTNLIADTMASLQGPAIWAYNDAMFSKSDFENIIRLGAGTKKEDTSKVGRFGLGFNAVYNLTDVPCFVSGHILAMFDPQVRYLGRGAGLKLDFTKPINKALLSRMPEQFQPFQNIFGCTLTSSEHICYKGTLFRFPLRTTDQAVKNKLKEESYSESKRREFLKMLLEKAGSLLLFTQNVKEVEVFYISHNCSDPNDMKCLLTVKKCCLATVLSQPQKQMNYRTVLQFMKEYWSKKYSDIKIQQKLQIKMEVTAEAIGVCGVEKSNSSTQWQVAWASGTGTSATMAHLKMNEGLVPLAAAAVSVSDSGLIALKDNPSGFYNTGHLYCFLPLPENLEMSRVLLPVHVNGTFALTSDRRGLIIQTEDDLNSEGSSWNTELYRDAVCHAYLLLLQQVSKEAAMDGDFSKYFDLWPRRSIPCLVQGFYHHLQSGCHKVLPVPGQNNWVTFTDAYFLQPQFRESDCGRIAWKALQNFWKRPGYLVDVPFDICKLMENKGPPGTFTAKVITELAFYRDYFFPNMESEWWESEERDRLTHRAVMQDNKEISQLIKENPCIPCQGGKLLRKPAELVSPKGLVASLYLESEHRFPQTAPQDSENSALSKTDFCSEITLQHLSKLGMVTDRLPWDMVLERAKSIGSLNALNRVGSLSRASSLLNYLSVYIDTNLEVDLKNCPSGVHQLLSHTAFLPVLIKPSEWPFPWADSEATDSSILAPPADLCLDTMKNLVACKRKLLNIKMLEQRESLVMGKNRKVLKALGVVVEEDCSDKNLFHCVLDQLVTVAEQHNQDQRHKELSQSISSDVYAYLTRCLKRNDGNIFQDVLHSQLTDKSIIWTGNLFVRPSLVAFYCPYECTPHLFRLGDSYQMNKRVFFEAAGVKERFTVSDILLVLDKVNANNNGRQLPKDTIDLVSRIAQLLGDTVRHREQSEMLDPHRVFLPDIHGFMCQACSLCVDDCSLQTKLDRMKFVNEKIPPETAKLLGVKTKQKQHYSCITRSINVKPFGQFEKLTTRIKHLLQGYTFDSSLCKELLQNADDAEATDAKFIMDFRHLPKNAVPENWESLQGPALCFYNNKSFTAEDMEGIQNLGVGSKGENDLKIGQFGVGFNAVFHVTDVPSFWTKVDNKEDVICVLDPNCQYVSDTEPSKPGVAFTDIEEVKLAYPDFFSGYLDDAIDTSQPGTLFRFPLRTDIMAEKSQIKKDTVTDTDIKMLLDKFKDEVSACLLFLNNLQTIGIYSVYDDGSLKQEFEVKKTLDDASCMRLNNFKTSLQQASVKMKQNSANMEDIPVFQSVVQSKIVDSRGASEDWLTVHRVGFTETEGFSSELRHMWGKENFRLLPRGDVAVKLKAKRAEDSEKPFSREDYQAFCMLPLPVSTGLPAHVNGHFILDHETRRNLWDSGTSKDDIRSEWNEAIAFQVIVPAFIMALMVVKSILFPDNGKGFSKSLMTIALEKYHRLFPQPVKDAFWMNIVQNIYKVIAKKELELFPVTHAEEMGVEWMPAVRRDGFPGYFNNLIAIFADEIERKHSTAQVFLSSGISASSAYGRTKESSPIETAKELQDLLKMVNMKILEAPLHIYESFKASGVNEVQEVTASSVLVFLRSSGQAVCGGCNIRNLPKPVADTPLKTASNVKEVVRCICKDAKFSGNLDGLPLCLRQSETLHKFSTTENCKPIISKYYHLLPGSAEDFLHEQIIRFFTDLKRTSSVLQTLSIPMFASRLHKTLVDPCFTAGEPCILEQTSFRQGHMVEFGSQMCGSFWRNS